MKNNNFTTTILVDQTPEEVYRAIGNVRGWWSGLYAEDIQGDTRALHDEFVFRAGGDVHYSKQKVVEAVPSKKVVWLITDSALSFLAKADEWTGTRIVFDIARKGDRTALTFTHEGLVPEIECYEACSTAWGRYVQERLVALIEEGVAASGAAAGASTSARR